MSDTPLHTWSWAVPNEGADPEVFILTLRPTGVELLSHVDHYAGTHVTWTLDEVRRAGPDAPPPAIPADTWRALYDRLPPP